MGAQVPMNPQRVTLPSPLREQVAAAAREWLSSGTVARLWNRDAGVWTGAGEERWLGWLDAPETARGMLDDLRAFSKEIASEGFTHALLLGMGGSSLAPEVIRFTFGPLAGVECFEYLEYYDLGNVNYLDGMAAPPCSDERLPTRAIIASLRELGKTVQIKLWFEKGIKQNDAIM